MKCIYNELDRKI